MGRQYVCQACGRRLTVPDDLFARKVQGRIVRINCKGCGSPVSIDGTMPPPPVTSASPASEPPSSRDLPSETDEQDAEDTSDTPEKSSSSQHSPEPFSDPDDDELQASTDVATTSSFPDPVPTLYIAGDPGAGRFSHVDGPLPLREPNARVGRYALFDQFAEGGIATVHFGRLDGAGGFSRVVAIKRLLKHLANNEEFTAMLLKEACLAARVRHPNVVPTLDVVSAQGDMLLILEYVHGESLSKLCRIQAKHRKDHIPLDITATIMHDLLSGLCAVHEATDEKGRLLGMVHRDISPPNIVVGADGYARVLDFGIAKAIEQMDESMPNRLKGKIGYMSPEQIRGQSAAQSSDVFAAGIILWELLATRRLFASNNEADRMKQIVSGNYPRPSRYRSGLPKALEQVAMRALDAEPKARYQNAREFAEALEMAVPRASARRVAEWVNDLAKPTLTHRAHMIAQVENWVSGDTPVHSIVTATHTPLGKRSPAKSSGAPGSSGVPPRGSVTLSRTQLGLAVAAFGVLLLLLLYLLLK